MSLVEKVYDILKAEYELIVKNNDLFEKDENALAMFNYYTTFSLEDLPLTYICDLINYASEHGSTIDYTINRLHNTITIKFKPIDPKKVLVRKL